MATERTVTVQMSERVALGLRYILPVVAEGLRPAPNSDDTVAALQRACSDIDRALPDDLREVVDEGRIAEYVMDAIDAQRAAGVRPAAVGGSDRDA